MNTGFHLLQCHALSLVTSLSRKLHMHMLINLAPPPTALLMFTLLGGLLSGGGGGTCEVLAGPAGINTSCKETPVTVIGPSLATRPCSVPPALASKALARVTAASVPCDGVADAVLSGGNVTDALRA